MDYSSRDETVGTGVDQESQEETFSTSSSRADIGPAHSSFCDRRLSRAAVQILQYEIFPLVLAANRDLDDTNKNNYDMDDIINKNKNGWEQVWAELVDKHNSNNNDNGEQSNSCLLNPTQNVFYLHEKSSLKTIVTSQNSKRTRFRDRKEWHKCRLCGKHFVSQFYLDRHFDRVHSHELLGGGGGTDTLTESSSSSSSSSSIASPVCPATDWCPALGGVCELVAHQNEPPYTYYGSYAAVTKYYFNNESSNHHDQHRHSICREKEMIASQQVCRKMIHDCFGGGGGGGGGGDGHRNHGLETGVFTHTPASFVADHYCNLQNCHDRLHRLAGHVPKHLHSWREDWIEHYHGAIHSTGIWYALLIVVMGMIHLLSQYVMQPPRRQHLSSSARGKALFQKQKKKQL